MTAAAPLFAQIELAIQERLRAASRLGLLGYALRSVESLPIDVDDRLKEYVAAFPAAWTVFGGWSVRTQRSGGGAVIEARYSVICAASNLRSERAARHGAGGDVGTYQMIADVTGLLLGNGLGLPVGPLVLGDCQNLYTGKLQGELKASLYGVSFTSTLTLDAAPADILDSLALGDFATFNVGWIPPLGGEDTAPTGTLQTLETAS
ncbi:DUF1834 family protein [Rhizobium sp. CRIBSB]|nr:DUF1834 family protein [Rhizobium sp. CRIBSB]